MSRFLSRLVVAGVVVGICSACAVTPASEVPPAKTDLMLRLERDGAGDLSGAGISPEALQAWLQARPGEYTQGLRAECRALRARAQPVAWFDSMDNRICNAVDAVAFFARPEPRSSGRTYRGGNR